MTRADNPTGAELAQAIVRRAAELGMTVHHFGKPLTDNPGAWVRELAKAKRPLSHTIERVRALLAGQPMPPPRPYQMAQTVISEAEAMRSPIPDPVDRDPCFLCGTRADIGCRHQAPGR